MYPPAETIRLAKSMTATDAETPVAAAWRYHEPARFGRTRAVASVLRGEARDAALRRHPLPRPSAGQWVVYPLSHTPATLGSLVPVLEELHRRGRAPFLLTGETTSAVAESQAISGHASMARLRANAPLRCRLRIARRAWSLAGRVASGLGSNSSRWTAWTWIYDGLLTEATAATWLDGAAGILLDSNLTAPQKGLLAAARGRGVPTAVLQHGFLGPHQFPLHADRLLCWGDAFLDDAVVRYNMPPEKGLVTGCPRWDSLPDLRRRSHDPVIRAGLERNAGQPVVLIISNAHAAKVYPDQYGPFFASVSALIDAGLNVALRLHPAEEGVTHYRHAIGARRLENLLVLSRTVGLYEAILHADVVYQVFSAAALEAIALGVPVLFEGGRGNERMTDYPDRGGGLWCSAGDIVSLCRRLSVSETERRALLDRQEAFLASMLANLGNAAARVADALATMEVPCPSARANPAGSGPTRPPGIGTPA